MSDDWSALESCAYASIDGAALPSTQAEAGEAFLKRTPVQSITLHLPCHLEMISISITTQVGSRQSLVKAGLGQWVVNLRESWSLVLPAV